MVSFLNLRVQLNESIRQGLPHITTMDVGQFHNLISQGQVPLHHITEKTDGSTFKIGHDEQGFYTQSSGSGAEKMRSPQDYLDRVTHRAKETGRDPDYTGARAFAEAHAALQRNHTLLDHLKQHHVQFGEAQVRGELFSRQLSRPSDENKNEVKIVGTSYNPSSWGKVGKIVIHSNLPENVNHDVEHFKNNLSSDEINFDDDKINVAPSAVDVKQELRAFSSLNHDLLRSRTTRQNKAAKLVEIAKFDAIKKSAADKVDSHVQSLGIRGKFGSGSEGLVVHPASNSVAPRFKVTTPQFRQYREKVKTGQTSFKSRQTGSHVNLDPRLDETYSFKNFLLQEGGNIKVKTAQGEVSAAPFNVAKEDRQTRAGEVRKALESLHDTFRKNFKKNLFGKNKKALMNGSAYSGSTRQFMNDKIKDDEYSFYKPQTGDLDIAIPNEHKENLTKLLQPGTKLGNYTVLGSKGHGNQISFAMQHPNGEVHQFDFEGTDYDGDEPSVGSQFLNSSNWEDTKLGIKGAHHKMLLNAIGGGNHKFSITHGLRSRLDDTDPGTKDPTKISKILFGKKARHADITSFGGLTRLIKNHVPQERYQEIYDKFKSSVGKKKGEHDNALGYLSNSLDIKDKEFPEQHTSVIPLVGFSPISHMGHAQDLGGALQQLPGTKHIGISEKADLFSPSERASIMNRQFGNFGQKTTVTKGVGQILRQAHNSLPEGKGRRVLHLLLGADRQDYGENLRRALMSGRIKEMEGNRFDRIELHAPQDTKRSHGMSGTKMRQAAADNNIDEFHRHLGSAFKREEASAIMQRINQGIQSGKVPLLREEMSHDDFEPMIKSFTKFAADELKLKKIPTVHFKNDKEHSEVTSFGGYNPSTKEILLQTKNRHPMDIFRTLAHEFVHAKQHEDDRIGHDIENEGKTGSEHENEANAMAGIVMRKFGKTNPKLFELEPLSEAIFVVGGPCSGKDRIVKQLKEAFMIPEFDIASFNHKVTQENDKIIISAPAHDLTPIRAANEQLRALNYKTSMIFVDVENNISKLRNEERAKRGQRVINESVRFEKLATSKNNLEHFRLIFEDVTIVNNSITEKKDPCWKGYEMIGMKKKGKREVPNCVPVKEEGRCWKGYEPVPGKKAYSKGSCKPVSEMDKKFADHVDVSSFPDTIPTAGVKVQPTSLHEKKCGCSQYEEDGSCKHTKKKIVKKKLAQEAEGGAQLSTASGQRLPGDGSPGFGPEIGIGRSLIGGLVGVSPMSAGTYMSFSPSTYGISESVQKWMMKEETQQKFKKKYGNLAEQKLLEAGINISKNMNTETKIRPKHFNELREAIEKTPVPGRSAGDVNLSGSVPSAGRFKDGDLEEDWSDTKHQDPRGGLKASGVRAYRREHPGSKLKTAVREKPSQLKKGGKRWKRRQSYCARSAGQMKMWPKAAKDPNSRLRKARRAWNCEE